MRHYIYMNGEPGCLPDYCDVSGTLDDALASFTLIFGDDTTDDQIEELRESGIVYGLNGAGYASISECDCPSPREHCESGDTPGACFCFGCEARDAQDDTDTDTDTDTNTDTEQGG